MIFIVVLRAVVALVTLGLLVEVSALENTFSQRRHLSASTLSLRQAQCQFNPNPCSAKDEKKAIQSSQLLKRFNNLSPVQQNLQVSPPLPIIQISQTLISQSVKNSSSSQKRAPGQSPPGSSSPHYSPLFRRDAELCGPGNPCADGSCCNKSGICGYGPTYCGSGNCTSNCDATAMCGRYSEGGNLKCGMNLCCSYYGWCGTDEIHCGDPDPNGLTPCQENFGLCKIIPPPSCPGGSSIDKRTIGYYQASNTYERKCNAISPNQIKSDGFTHLNFAFASIDPTSYAVVPANTADIPLYTQFTALKTSSMQTWIAIGGFDFSDNGTTHTTWSDMTSTHGSRAAFISSLKAFMAQYGFQGVDLDWEYPATPARGGGPADTENYVSLVQEMRTAFGTEYGISLTLAPDYWYLRGFDAISMQPYVDWFGFMAYDLHGSWDANTPTLGAFVRGQTDIREIYNDTMPLWFDGLNPAKINFGLAFYGRGYTLADPSCNYLGCPFTGPSNPGSCTDFPGVMSLVEINQLILQKRLTPTLIADAMMKQITWDNQWIGYDDIETIAMKILWAENLCFGGTMVWSVDFDSGIGSGLVPGNTTTNGLCGASNGATVCGDWVAGSCCSSSGYCGNDTAHCGEGCQSGSCLTSATSVDGSCGISPGGTQTLCTGWPGGNCCSASGYCGNDTAHCGQGCQSGFCLPSVATNDGTCGVSPGGTLVTCDNWSSGGCCSNSGYCGSDEAYCGSDCQFGCGVTNKNGANNNWQLATCTAPPITNAALNQTIRWNSVYTDDAWGAAIAYYNADPTAGGLSFPELISNFFNGPESMMCGQTADHNGCDTYILCSATDYPAGYFILNSFVAINNIIMNFYDAIFRVEDGIIAGMSNFASTFAPIEQESDAEKIILDFIGLGFALVASPVWNSALKGFAYFKDNPNTLATIKDDVNPLVSNGVTIAKDTSTNGVIDPSNVLETTTAALIHMWYNTTAAINKDLFNGSAQSISQLGAMMTGGQVIEQDDTVDDPTIQMAIEQALYGYLIPQAWSLSNEDINPFILDSGFPCSAVNPLPQYMSNSDGDASWTCIDNQLYYLMSVTGKPETCDIVPCGISTCTDNFFSLPPGLASLDGTQFAGVTYQMFTIGAVASYKANKNQNGWPAADPSSSSSLSALYDTGIETPGVVQIPVCSAEIAFGNWLDKSPGPNYPCTSSSSKRSIAEIKEDLLEKRRLESRC